MSIRTGIVQRELRALEGLEPDAVRHFVRSPSIGSGCFSFTNTPGMDEDEELVWSKDANHT